MWGYSSTHGALIVELSVFPTYVGMFIPVIHISRTMSIPYVGVQKPYGGYIMKQQNKFKTHTLSTTKTTEE